MNTPTEREGSRSAKGTPILCCSLFPALQRTLMMDQLAPGTVHRVRRATHSVGGKAVNSARVLRTLGSNPLLFGFAGGATGAQIRNLLSAEQIPAELIDSGSESRVCQTLLFNDREDCTELVEDAAPVPKEGWTQFLDAFSHHAAQSKAWILAGTVPEHAPRDIYARLLDQVGSRQVLIDTAGDALLAAIAAHPALVKINATELLHSVPRSGVASYTGNRPAECVAAARTLLDRGATAVGITDGPRPALLVTRDEAVFFSLPAVPLVSSLGGGDCVNAGFILALIQGKQLADAFRFGLACGLSNAMHPLPGTVDPARIPDLAGAITPSPFLLASDNATH